MHKRDYVFPSAAFPGKFYWTVFNTAGVALVEGYTDTKEWAVRAARNFIRHNQNAVYG